MKEKIKKMKKKKEKRIKGIESNAVSGGNYVNCYRGFLHCAGWLL